MYRLWLENTLNVTLLVSVPGFDLGFWLGSSSYYIRAAFVCAFMCVCVCVCACAGVYVCVAVRILNFGPNTYIQSFTLWTASPTVQVLSGGKDLDELGVRKNPS